jgi:hypothetical protein
LQVCKNPAKVQARASELSSEVIVASQAVPSEYKGRSRGDRDREDVQPVNAASFYDTPDAWLADRTQRSKPQLSTISSKSNPYLNAFAAQSRMPLGPGILHNVADKRQAQSRLGPVAKRVKPITPTTTEISNPHAQLPMASELTLVIKLLAVLSRDSVAHRSDRGRPPNRLSAWLQDAVPDEAQRRPCSKAKEDWAGFGQEL